MQPRRIGLIQTRGIGDIIISLPIADHYIEQGCEVVWPVDEDTFVPFQKAKPEIIFLPVARRSETQSSAAYFYDEPRRLLEEAGCSPIVCLYSYLGLKEKVYDAQLFSALKFDEYKYAISNVPFARKWTLNYERDLAREEALYERLNITGPYVCIHDTGSDVKFTLALPEEITRGHQIVRVENLSDNFFDWRLTFERAAKLVMIDSSLSNLVEGLNLPNEKYLLVRSAINFTPVLRNGWKYVFVNPVAPAVIGPHPMEQEARAAA